jgi:hypothetical protein
LPKGRDLAPAVTPSPLLVGYTSEGPAEEIEMVNTHPVTFQCPRCAATADLYVSPGGKAEESSEFAGMIYSIDYQNPRESSVLCPCSMDDTGLNTEMKKIREA